MATDPAAAPAPAPGATQAPNPAAPAPAPQPGQQQQPNPAAPNPSPAPAPSGDQPQPAPAAPAAGDPPATDVSFRSLVDSVPDENVRNVLKRMSSITDVGKAIIELRTDNSGRVKVPGDDATDEDKAKFRKAIGLPDKPEDYVSAAVTALDAKPGQENAVPLTDADKAIIQQTAPMFYEEGVSPAAFQRAAAKFLELSRGMEQQAVQQINDFGAAAEQELKREWGADFTRNAELSARAASSLGGPTFKAFVDETVLPGGGKLGDHPVMVRFLASMGRRTDEGDMQLGPTPEARQSIQSQIDELNAKVPVGSRDYASQAHQDRLQSLYKQLHGTSPIVGGGLRTA